MSHLSLLARVAAVSTIVLSGCAATVGTGGGVFVPPTAAATCQEQCRGIGLELGAVVVMANNVGCVCQPKGAVATLGGRAAVAGGMAAIAQMHQAQQQNQTRR